MNGRIAKALRKMAREQTKGMPERQLIVRGREVAPGKVVPVDSTVFNNPNSTRGRYRLLKKQHNRTRHV